MWKIYIRAKNLVFTATVWDSQNFKALRADIACESLDLSTILPPKICKFYCLEANFFLTSISSVFDHLSLRLIFGFSDLGGGTLISGFFRVYLQGVGICVGLYILVGG